MCGGSAFFRSSSEMGEWAAFTPSGTEVSLGVGEAVTGRGGARASEAPGRRLQPSLCLSQRLSESRNISAPPAFQ